MRLRPYIQSKDFKHIAGWIDNERSHALWCANNSLKEEFPEERFLQEVEKDLVSEKRIEILKY